MKKIIVTETDAGYDIKLKINPDTFNVSGLFGFNGGEGAYLPKSKFLLHIEDKQILTLCRSMQIEDLLIYNKIYI